jgi:hypothetical protein
MSMNRLFVALLAALASACATPSVYHERDGAGSGYSESQLSTTRWRVEYAGDGVDSADRVEQFMMRRAAEITIRSGYDWFTQSDESLEGEIVVQAPAAQSSAPVDAVWRPRWRMRSRSRWTDWDPRGAAGRGVAPPPSVTTRFHASAVIVMGRAPGPAGALDARAVLANPVE